MCKVNSKVTHIKQQKYFYHLKGRGYNKEVYYIHGTWCDENIFSLFYMCDFAMGLTHCYKTSVFLFLKEVSKMFYSYTKIDIGVLFTLDGNKC